MGGNTCQRSSFRPPLEKILFPMKRPSGSITANWELFLPIFANFNFFLTEKKEEKKMLRPPDWPQFRPSARQETMFFLRVASVDDHSRINLKNLFSVQWPTKILQQNKQSIYKDTFLFPLFSDGCYDITIFFRKKISVANKKTSQAVDRKQSTKCVWLA